MWDGSAPRCQRTGYGLAVRTVDLDDIPVPCAILGGDILGVYCIDHRGELHLVGVIEHDKVVQTQITGDTAGTLRNLLLDTAVGDEGIGLMRYGLTEACHEETLGDCRTDGHDMTLTQRAGGVLDAAQWVQLGMSGGYAAPLTELCQFVESILAIECKNTIQHR